MSYDYNHADFGHVVSARSDGHFSVDGIAQPAMPVPVLFARVGPDGSVAFKQGDTPEVKGGPAWVVRPGAAPKVIAPQTVGNWPCAWDKDGNLYIRTEAAD